MDSTRQYEQLCAAVKAAGWRIELDRGNGWFGLHVVESTGRKLAGGFVFEDIEDLDAYAVRLLDWFKETTRTGGTDATLL